MFRAAVKEAVNPNSIRVADMARMRRLGIDTSLVGDGVGWGLRHRVYQCGGEVVKVPIPWMIFPPHGAEKSGSDLATMRQYFPNNVPDTKVVTSKNSGGYLILQEFLSQTSPVSTNNIEAVEIPFADLVKANRRLQIDQGKSLDFVGLAGVISGLKAYGGGDVFHLANIAIVDGRLLTIDPDLLWLSRKLYGESLLEGAVYLVNIMAFRLHQRLIIDHFGINIGMRNR